jgi:hypothetical protein
LLKRKRLTRLPLRQLDVMAAHELRSADSLLDWCAFALRCTHERFAACTQLALAG